MKNYYNVAGDTAIILIRSNNHNLTTFIDLEDLETVKKAFTKLYIKEERAQLYAFGIHKQTGLETALHNVICKGADHINPFDTLNNRKINLQESKIGSGEWFDEIFDHIKIS